RASNLYFFCLVLAFVIYLTVISDLGRFAYITAITIFIFFLAYLQLETLGIFQYVHEKAFFFLLIVAYVPLTYYFHSYDKDVPIWVRFVIYSVITAVFIFIGATYSKSSQPIFTILHYGIVIPFGISVVFIILNASEIIRAFLFVTTTSTLSGTSNARHFFILSLIYLLNLTYFIAKTAFGIDWKIFYIHPFYILLASSTIGIWGFQKREEHYEGMMNFVPTGALLYLSLAIITFSTITFSLLEVNDAWIEIFEDTIAYSHLAWGIATVAYVFVNFLDPLLNNLPVHKIYYKPRTMDYMSAWLGGLVILGALFFRANFFQYKQAFAAYYIGLAEVSRAEEDIFACKQYLKLATAYDVRSFRANYTLALLALEAKERDVASLFFKESVQRRTVPQVFAYLAALYQQENRYFEAIFQLREGLKKCPKSGELANNLALLYNQHSYGDSAYYYFDWARKNAELANIPASNLYAIFAKYEFPDSLYEQIYESLDKTYVGIASNELAYLNQKGYFAKVPFNPSFLPDSVLNTPQLCYLYNAAIHYLTKPQQEIIDKLNFYIHIQANDEFRPFLEYVLALTYYAQGHYKKAFNLMDKVVKQGNLLNADYPNLLGKWYLQQEAYEIASAYFFESFRRGEKEALLNKAIALSETKRKEEALEDWETLMQIGSPQEKKLAQEMIRALRYKDFSSKSIPVMSDWEKYLILHFHMPDSATLETWIKTMNDTSLVFLLRCEKVQKLLEEVRIREAEAMFKKILPSSKPLYYQTRLALKYHLQQFDDEYKRLLEKDLFLPPIDGLHSFYSAAYYASRDTAQAIRLYQQALEKIPAYFPMYRALADFYNAIHQPQKAYDILLDALERFPQSVELNKLYVLQCLECGYTNYATYGMQDLKFLLSDVEYRHFEKEYEAKKEQKKQQYLRQFGDSWESNVDFKNSR
ncbi:MAG: hypothetical protein RMJ89_02240, partial [Flammeovirgaceae bacterium]|nr:hypothetical protein [Flammeovirgaceae bacterium]